jgi:hypothetical protein
MAQPSVIVRCGAEGLRDTWQPTALDQLGKDEKFFENVLATSPELLGLETRRTGVHGPFKSFQQPEMQTPSGRAIYPDIVLLAASGHVAVVEVQRSVNSELRDRAVIVRIIDYDFLDGKLEEFKELILWLRAIDPQVNNATRPTIGRPD